jgi:hypothetical protein
MELRIQPGLLARRFVQKTMTASGMVNLGLPK